MKKPKPRNKTAPWHSFPNSIKDWTDEDHALGGLARGLRFKQRDTSQPHLNVFPFPAFYVPSMEQFFKWFGDEISEKGNQDAANRLYYLALLAVRNLLAACEARPDLYRPIAKHQLYWPSMTGWPVCQFPTSSSFNLTRCFWNTAPKHRKLNGWGLEFCLVPVAKRI